MKIKSLFFVFLFAIVLTGLPIYAQSSRPIEIKLASPMPRSSVWGRTLERMAADWASVTNGAVTLRVIHDGREGSESKMLSSISLNVIHGGLFTAFGIGEICPGIMTLSIPFLIKNDQELDMVFKEMQPILDAQLSKTKFAVIAWSKSGWVNIFSKDPVFTPDDLRKQRMASNPDAGDMNRAFKSMGFNITEIETLDLAPRLANGTITAIYQAPAAVAPVGMHKYLKNMHNLPLAPFLGGFVINRETWEKISPAHREALIKVTQKHFSEFDASMPRTVAQAMAVMEKDGLVVNKLTSAQEAMWYNTIQNAMPSLFGRTFDRDMYLKITEILGKIRNK
ncbi:MAG: TRAP transporter substrate-binding protein DctP [Treponema sp.]|nr:TRAP transporter substrate-binding protein DctP [Treponema sp.]